MAKTRDEVLVAALKQCLADSGYEALSQHRYATWRRSLPDRRVVPNPLAFGNASAFTAFCKAHGIPAKKPIKRVDEARVFLSNSQLLAVVAEFVEETESTSYSGYVAWRLELQKQGQAAPSGPAIADEAGTASVSVDVIENSVSVGLPSVAEIQNHRSTGRRSDRSIEVEYEVEPELQLDACTSRTSCGSGTDDVRGGLTTSDANGNCTTGFVFETFDGKTYVSVAGHCDNTPNKLLTIGGQTSGPLGRYHYEAGSNTRYEGSTSDAVLIEIDPSESSNLVYRAGNSKYHWITEREYFNYPVGSRVCVASGFTWWRCGIVTDSSLDIVSNGGLLALDQIQWTFADNRTGGFGGASGGPLISGARALGTHRASRLSLPLPNGRFAHRMIGAKIFNMELEFRNAGFVGATVRTTRN